MPSMDTTITMDSAGRIVLPKALRDQFGLHPGSEFELRHDGTEIRLRPLSEDRPLEEVNGFLVYTGRSARTSEDSIEHERSARLKRVYAR
jgi:AbrB family looped-hinge helix DNA binding protein